LLSFFRFCSRLKSLLFSCSFSADRIKIIPLNSRLQSYDKKLDCAITVSDTKKGSMTNILDQVTIGQITLNLSYHFPVCETSPNNFHRQENVQTWTFDKTTTSQRLI
jgi:hypothetical protein